MGSGRSAMGTPVSRVSRMASDTPSSQYRGLVEESCVIP